jgi:hypothetical protein
LVAKLVRMAFVDGLTGEEESVFLFSGHCE